MSAAAVRLDTEAELDDALQVVDDEMARLVVRDIRKSHRIRHAARVRRGEAEPLAPDNDDALLGDGFEEQPPHRQFILALERIAKGR
jgi:hypothetical protein